MGFFLGFLPLLMLAFIPYETANKLAFFFTGLSFIMMPALILYFFIKELRVTIKHYKQLKLTKNRVFVLNQAGLYIANVLIAQDRTTRKRILDQIPYLFIRWSDITSVQLRYAGGRIKFPFYVISAKNTDEKWILVHHVEKRSRNRFHKELSNRLQESAVEIPSKIQPYYRF